MDDKHLTSAPVPASNTRIADLKRHLKIAKAVKAAVILVIVVVGTVLPLLGVGMPRIDLPSVDLPSFGFMDRAADTDLPGWLDRALDILKKVKNGVVALLVLAAVLGEHERRRRQSAAADSAAADSDEPDTAEPPVGATDRNDRTDRPDQYDQHDDVDRHEGDRSL